MTDGVSRFADRFGGKRETVTIVGSGITGLMSAWEADKAGYKVHVISQSPDPRKEKEADNKQSQHSATFDGQDQRYITLFEGHPYLDLIEYVQAVYPDIGEDFMKPVLKGGVLAMPFEDFSKRSQEWLKKRKGINDRLQGNDRKLKKAIKKLFNTYAEENRAAMKKWYGFIGELLETDPNLVKKISLNHDGIMRLYDNKDVLEASAESHDAGHVFKKRYTPTELEKDFSAYKEGVDNGFIQGGAVEMHGLTLGVKTIGEAMIRILKEKGVDFTFETHVKKIIKNDQGKVDGLQLADGNVVKSKHYILHPGAMGLQELCKEVAPDVHNTIAAIEGYWITVDNAEKIVEKMGGKPNKVHGKQSIESLLNKVDAETRAKFTEMFHALGVTDFEHIAPIVDFNIMPIYSEDGKVTLGAGSGYIFKGLPEPDEKGDPKFEGDKDLRSQQFVLALMKLWLVVLYGTELLPIEKMNDLHKGCKRSWTINDKEIDRNIITADGGVLAIRAGGNTGDTTKSTFVAEYNIALLQAVDKMQADGKKVTQKAIREIGRDARKSLRKKPEEVDFEKLTAELDKKVADAKILATTAGRSGRPETSGPGAATGRS